MWGFGNKSETDSEPAGTPSPVPKMKPIGPDRTGPGQTDPQHICLHVGHRQKELLEEVSSETGIHPVSARQGDKDNPHWTIQC